MNIGVRYRKVDTTNLRWRIQEENHTEGDACTWEYVNCRTFR